MKLKRLTGTSFDISNRNMKHYNVTVKSKIVKMAIEFDKQFSDDILVKINSVLMFRMQKANSTSMNMNLCESYFKRKKINENENNDLKYYNNVKRLGTCQQFG